MTSPLPGGAPPGDVAAKAEVAVQHMIEMDRCRRAATAVVGEWGITRADLNRAAWRLGVPPVDHHTMVIILRSLRDLTP
ncbi:hypothetical protein ACOZ38_29525 [Sphaerisporangium viridialbum]|uniref:hypothetical protein n=1 Tax=Sphaerisporangium viridialbum TaxID=46189 RepID=UPI003C774752